MRLTVLGCAGSFPGPESACSAYLVEAEGFRLLIDFGSGSLSALQRYAGLHSVDAILLTHLHCDHMLDACTYVVVRRYAPSGPLPAVPVYAPAGAAERISAAYSQDSENVDDVYTFYGLQPGTFPIGPLTVTVDRVNHPIETYGVRVEHEGRVITAAGARRRPVPVRGELPGRLREPTGPAPHRPGGGRGGDEGGRRQTPAHAPGAGVGKRGRHGGRGVGVVRGAGRGRPARRPLRSLSPPAVHGAPSTGPPHRTRVPPHHRTTT
jgi:hypothetical protein